jgi:hypothetical protein
MLPKLVPEKDFVQKVVCKGLCGASALARVVLKTEAVKLQASP